jgi:hypothetical protein
VISRWEEEARKQAKIHFTGPQLWGRSPGVYYHEAESAAKAWEIDPARLAAKAGTGLDVLAVAEEAAMGSQLANRTVFKSVKRLLPGERIISSASGDAIETCAFPEASSNIIDSLSEQVCEAFRKGAALELSGGLDSSLVLAFGLHRNVKPRISFTIGDECSADVINATAIAKEFDLPHLRIPVVINREQMREDIVSFIRRSGYSVNAANYAWLPGTLAQLNGMRTAQVSGNGGEICGGFYYTPVDSALEKFSLERIWIASRLLSPRARWSFLWRPDIARDLEAQIYAEVHAALHRVNGTWRERTDAFYRDERIRRWVIPVFDACEALYEVISPFLSPEYIGWATSLDPAVRTRDRRPQRELLWQACPALATFSGVSRQTERAPVFSTIRKTLRRLAGQRQRSALGARESAVALAGDPKIREWIGVMCADSNLEFSTEGVERVLDNPAEYPELLGVLVNASVAWRDVHQSASEEV